MCFQDNKCDTFLGLLTFHTAEAWTPLNGANPVPVSSCPFSGPATGFFPLGLVPIPAIQDDLQLGILIGRPWLDATETVDLFT